MRRLSLTCALLLAGCSTAPSLQPSGVPPRIEATAGGYDIRLSDDTGPSQVTLNASADAAWTALMQAYQELGIPVTTIDTRQRLIGNQKYEVRRRVAGQQVSTFVDCGSNLAGSIADNYRIELFMMSKLEPRAEGGTVLQTRLTGTGRSNEGASGNPVNCGSTGRMEARLARMVRQKVGG